jgi:hypothetical protein
MIALGAASRDFHPVQCRNEASRPTQIRNVAIIPNLPLARSAI